MPADLSPASLGFARVAVVSPELRVADVSFNVQAIGAALRAAADRGCRLALFPELCLTGYSCGDLFFQATLLDRARAALAEVAETADAADIAAVVGLPLAVDGRLYNCAAFIAGGRVLGFVPKSYLPNTDEFYEARWFTPGRLCPAQTVAVDGATIPIGADLLFAADDLPDFVAGVEVCEDLWAVQPPSGDLALAGATVLLNGSASDEQAGKAEHRRDLVRQQSACCLAAYLYAGAGAAESTTDTVWAGHSLVAEAGAILAETERFRFDTAMAVADIDVNRLALARVKNSAFGQAAARVRPMRTVRFALPGAARAARTTELLRPDLSRTPFVPEDEALRAQHCREVFAIQTTGLVRRLLHVGASRAVLGVSGGLDSALALLVTAKAFDRIGLPRAGIVAVVMPGFGTTARSLDNARRLSELAGATLRVIPIVDAVRGHFRDIGHDETTHDITYENAQARERTQILMDVGNQVGGFVVGTGDLSELALGWATFNADHMSMYHVNAGVPKSLIRPLLAWAAEAEFSAEVVAVIRDIIAAPISPELLPLGQGGELAQKTEDTIGPYVLHDFFLYYTVRFQFAPRKVFALARQAFAGEYPAAAIIGWLRTFYRRFFSQQYKRSAMPDGPKVGPVALSPRGDWRMPSDASAAAWLAEVESLSDI